MSYKNAVFNEGQGQEMMTIVVETLTGTSFEVTVSPKDNVKSIKSKIQRVEGIPISHQHLLYNSKELQDSSCVTEPDVALHDRATIKLVLSMRGGPISLVHQAVPLNRTILKNLVKFNREELIEDLPPGCRMAILVLRVGDQLNMIHFLEDADDISDSLSNSKDSLSFDLVEGESSKTLEENSITMEKVCDLKERMGKLSLQRKSLKADLKSNELTQTTLSPAVPKTSKPGSSLKLPSIRSQVNGEALKSRSEFSQVPILPDIIPHSTSRELEFISLDEEASSSQMCNTIRPKTCPGSLTESQFYDVFNEDSCQDTLQFSQPHFRSCVSACASKLRHEWGGGKTLLQSLNILPPITGVADVLNNHRKLSNIEPRNTQTIPLIENLNLHRNKLKQLKQRIELKQNLRKESNFNSNRSESAFLSKNINYSGKTLSSVNSEFYSTVETKCSPSNSYDLFPKVSSYDSPSLKTPMDLTYSDLLSEEGKSNLVEPMLNKKINFDKKSRLRCSECKKKLSLTSTFECRCGFAFCSYHRYSETHHCTYDFKKESRKMLEQANPTIVAPKLPKI